jgi:hypothetical protein
MVSAIIARRFVLDAVGGGIVKRHALGRAHTEH